MVCGRNFTVHKASKVDPSSSPPALNRGASKSRFRIGRCRPSHAPNPLHLLGCLGGTE